MAFLRLLWWSTLKRGREKELADFTGIEDITRPMSRAVQLRSIAFQRAVTALLISQLLVIIAMTVSPALHHWAHHDSDSPDHECAVTLFAHGGSDAAPAALVLVVFLAVLRNCLQRRGDAWIGSLFLSRRVLEHAPPVVA